MNKNNNEHLIIFGGAGYAGTFIVYDLIEKFPNSKITIVTRNLTKKIFFRQENVSVINDISKIKNEQIRIVNLAFSLHKTFQETKASNNLLFQNIEKIIKNNTVNSFVHVSTIVLTQSFGLKIPKIRKNNMYEFSKSIAENNCKKIAKKYSLNVNILRSGNILGPGSPWIEKIAKRLIEEKPILGLSDSYPSNTTFIGNLSYAIIRLLNQKSDKSKITLMNFCEFGDISWHDWVEEVNKSLNRKIKFWPIHSLNQIKIGYYYDFLYVFRQSISFIIPIAYKTKKIKSLILKLIDLFSLSQVEKKAKGSIKNIEKTKSEYYDGTEYSLQGVFMYEKSNKLENVPDEIIKNLPFDIKYVKNSINSWINFSGMHNL